VAGDKCEVQLEEFKTNTTETSQSKEDFGGAIFERMIIVLPYCAPDAVKAIEASFIKTNLENLNIENATYLNTKELSKEERADRSLDFLSGFEIMDSEFRMFIVEGLGGEGHAMRKFY